MDLLEAMRSNITCRYYKDEPVPDEVLLRLFDAARFAPNGGNRQPVRFIAVRDASKKKVMRDLYLPIWKEYLKGVDVGAIQVKGVRRLIESADFFAE
ncbi:MAG: nitroreductase family protein, partial [Myxococcales bacterium]|nr:nitroreductase family protein [Myxococcales bacterium]